MNNQILIQLVKDDVQVLAQLIAELEEDAMLKDTVEIALVRARSLVKELELIATKTKASGEVVPPSMPRKRSTVPIESTPGGVVDDASETYGSEGTLLEAPVVCEDQPLTAAETTLEDVAPDAPVNDVLSEEELSVAESMEEEVELSSSEDIHKTLGESLVSSQRSLNDLLQNSVSQEYAAGSRPIESLRSGIGINDRFLYTRELFDNDVEQFNHAVEQLDGFETINEAVNFLKSHYKWSKSETSQKFLQLVKRRYSNN